MDKIVKKLLFLPLLPVLFLCVAWQLADFSLSGASVIREGDLGDTPALITSSGRTMPAGVRSRTGRQSHNLPGRSGSDSSGDGIVPEFCGFYYPESSFQPFALSCSAVKWVDFLISSEPPRAGPVCGVFMFV